MDKRSDFQKNIGDMAEEVTKERLGINEDIERFRNNFVEYMKGQDIITELDRIKEEQKNIEMEARRQEERKRKSWIYRFLCKLKKTV